jgi:hypothetical protein
MLHLQEPTRQPLTDLVQHQPQITPTNPREAYSGQSQGSLFDQITAETLTHQTGKRRTPGTVNLGSDSILAGPEESV